MLRANKYTVTVAWADKVGRLPCGTVTVVDDSLENAKEVDRKG